MSPGCFKIKLMGRIKGILVLFTVLFAMQLQSQEHQIGVIEARNLASIFLEENERGSAELVVKVLFVEDINIPETYLFELKPHGFVVISSTNILSPVLAYSFDNNFADPESYEGRITLEIIKEIAVNDLRNPEGVKSANGRILQYGPYVYTMWGQVNCHDNTGKLINVSNIYTPNHYAPGCVAVSQVTVMHHYSWPPRGFGSHSYTDNQGSSTGFYSANYEDSYYDWHVMLDRYRSKPSTIEERECVGDVTMDVAISVNMDFEYDGSTSNVNRIPGSYANYFRFTSLYKSRSASSFWPLLDSNMAYKKPAILAISGSWGGHSVICDGLKIDESNDYLYHLNMGWWGVSNGWYKIRGSFDAGGYNYIDGAVMNIVPEPFVLQPEISSDSSVTKLIWMYPENAEAEAFELQVAINNGGWETLADNITDTSYNLAPNIENSYKYRVRAKTNGRWLGNSWGNEVSLHVNWVSILERNSMEIKVYPNPFSNALQLQFEENHKEGILEVFDITGKKLIEDLIMENSNGKIIDTGKWPKGIYIIEISTSDKTYSAKAIKK